MIKCMCGDKDCKAVIRFDSISQTILTEGNDNNRHDQLFYLTPDAIVDFIHQLKEMLDYIVNNPKK